MFLTDDISTQVGTMALVPQVAEAVRVPVIAAGGIADARASWPPSPLGASAVQIGTAYLFCPEAKVSAVHRRALESSKDNGTVITNVFTGRPARGILNRLVREVGPVSDLAPEFPLAGGAVAPLRASSEAAGSEDFVPLWSGQAARLLESSRPGNSPGDSPRMRWQDSPPSAGCPKLLLEVIPQGLNTALSDRSSTA